MLVLQFDHAGDKMVIDIPPSTEARRVTLTLNTGSFIRFGFEAPREIKIIRSELLGPDGTFVKRDRYVPRGSR